MSILLKSEVPCSNEFLTGLSQHFPEVDSYSFYTYLTLRKVSSELENALESYFATYGVSTGRFMLLLLLSSKNTGMMPSELAHQCGVTQATISGLLNGLEKAKLVVRETHSHDGRAYVIKLSPQGCELLNLLKPEFLKCIDGIMSQFSVEEKQQMVNSLARFNNSLKMFTELKIARNMVAN